MMLKRKRAVCPGSFDPVTKGHIDVFERAAKIFDELIVGVFNNPSKKSTFDNEERVCLLKQVTVHIPNVKIDSFSGLLHDYMKKIDAKVIVRGLRALSDFEYEFQRALMINKIDQEIETVFMMTKAEYSFISSTAIKELAFFGAELIKFVPEIVQEKIYSKLNVNEKVKK